MSAKLERVLWWLIVPLAAVLLGWLSSPPQQQEPDGEISLLEFRAAESEWVEVAAGDFIDSSDNLSIAAAGGRPQPHGNSYSSPKPSHVYVITRKNQDSGRFEVFKYGISSGNRDGSKSTRALNQIKYDLKEKYPKQEFSTRIINQFNNRLDAIKYEAKKTHLYLTTNNRLPPGMNRPTAELCQKLFGNK